MDTEVRILKNETTPTAGDRDFVRVYASTDPDNGTVTLATIERVVARPAETRAPCWRVKTLVFQQPMSLDAAVGLATCYAKRKNIPVICTGPQ